MRHTKAIGIGIACVALVAGAFAVWKLDAPASPAALRIDEATALAHLQNDMQDIEPHFVDARMQTAQALSLTDDKIKSDVAELYSARYSYALSPDDLLRTGLWLSAIGKRYILVTEAGAESIHDTILDSQTGMVARIPSLDIYDLAPDRDLKLYIDAQALYTYSLDHATTTPVANSQLSGGETYHDGAGEILDHAHESHTIESITISVFDTGSRVPNPDGGTMYEKIGEKTLTF